MDSFKEAYRENAYELLEELENSLLELEETPDDAELVGRIFRAMHTIKGSGAMFGFDNIVGFTHDLETFFDHVRAGKAAVTKKIVDLTLLACDLIREMVDAEVPEKDRTDMIIRAFRERLTEDNVSV
jgi:two-component system, chemotaxis family, sensor kinase CheA